MRDLFLLIVLACSTFTASPGDVYTYRVVLDATTAARLEARIDLPPGVELERVTPSNGFCTNDGAVWCWVDTPAVIDLEVRAAAVCGLLVASVDVREYRASLREVQSIEVNAPPCGVRRVWLPWVGA